SISHVAVVLLMTCANESRQSFGNISRCTVVTACDQPKPRVASNGSPPSAAWPGAGAAFAVEKSIRSVVSFGFDAETTLNAASLASVGVPNGTARTGAWAQPASSGRTSHISCPSLGVDGRSVVHGPAGPLFETSMRTLPV